MKRFIATLVAPLVATGALAAAQTQEVQAAGSEGPKARAESIHLARQHGLPGLKQNEVQRAGTPQAQMKAEEIHLKKQHGNLFTAEEQMLRDAPRL